MRFWPISQQGGTPISARAAAIAVRGIGTATIADHLLQAVREGAPASYCSIVMVSRQHGAQDIGAASVNGKDLRKAGREYAQRGFYRSDKNGLFLQQWNHPGLVTVQDRGEISQDWRSYCYDPFRITERCSIVMRSGTDGWTSVSFYRCHHDGAFSHRGLQWLVAFAPVLLSAVTTHLNLCRNLEQISTEQRLHALCAPLTKREREVVFAACKGMTNKQIANELGVEVTTVITHRQHAYMRLGVKCHSDLVRLLVYPNTRPC